MVCGTFLEMNADDSLFTSAIGIFLRLPQRQARRVRATPAEAVSRHTGRCRQCSGVYSETNQKIRLVRKALFKEFYLPHLSQETVSSFR